MKTYRIAAMDDAKILADVKQKAWEATYRGIYSDDAIDNFNYELHEQKFLLK